MKTGNGKSIRFQLWAGMMILIVTILIFLWLFQVVFLGSFYTSMHVSDIKKEAETIVESFNGSKTDFYSALDSYAYANNLNLEWIDTKGNTIYSITSMGSGTGNGMNLGMGMGMGGKGNLGMNTSKTDIFQSALSGKVTSSTITNSRFGNEVMLIGMPVYESDSISSALIINFSLAPVEDTVSILKRQLIIITGILLAASLIISLIMSKRFTKPILEIKKASENIAQGNFTSRIDIKRQDEIGELAQTINNMGQQLSQIEQLRKDLIANVSHELRTPLSLIQGYAETIRDVSGDAPEKREKQLGIIIEEAQRLSRIVDDILNLSQLQAGYCQMQKKSVSVIETVNKALSRYTILSEKTGVRLILEGGTERNAEIDAVRIEQVLYNLLNNAFNHTPNEGEISVKITETDNSIRISVSDTGSGISKEELPYIWDRYYKSDKSGILKVGTGLGLAIVKNILESHGSSYGVESVQGKGTTFWFELNTSN